MIRSIPLAAVVLALAGTGCQTAYQRATAPYAAAITKSVTAFDATFTLSDSLCPRRARLDRLQHLLEAAPTKTEQADWADHCEKLEAITALQRKSTQLLLAYANALEALSGGAAYDGADFKDTAGDVEKLAAALKADKLASYGDAVAAGATGLAQVLLNGFATHEIKQAIPEADPSVQKLLDGLDAYVAAARNQLKVQRRDLATAMNSAAVGLRPDGAKPVAPLDALEFERLRAELEDQAIRDAATLDAVSGVLGDLRKAQKTLVGAGKDDKELQTVIAAAKDIHAQVAALQKKLKEGETP